MEQHIICYSLLNLPKFSNHKYKLLIFQFIFQFLSFLTKDKLTMDNLLYKISDEIH